MSEQKKINGKTLLDRIMDELAKSGLITHEIEERARNILSALPEIDSYADIAKMLEPKKRDDGSEFRHGISDPLERVRAAVQCVAWYLAYQPQKRFALFASLQMFCGFDKDSAQKWMDVNVPLTVSENG
jgi:hypothetical protein